MNTESQKIKIDDLKLYPSNPRKGNVGAIAESLKENGQFQPLVVQKSTMFVLSGNHTLKAIRELKWKTADCWVVDVDDESAKRIVLAANRTADLASYDETVLGDILASLDQPHVGTGYSKTDVSAILEGIQEENADLVSSALYETHDPVVFARGDGDEPPADFNERLDAAKARTDALLGEDAITQEKAVELTEGDKNSVFAELQQVLEAKEGTPFGINDNYWGIPNLRTDMLLTEFPTGKVDTWAGKDVTPDDPETTWIYNWSLGSRTGMPWERSILSFFTWEEKFVNFLDNPAYYTAKMYVEGCRMAMVPDTSFWLNQPRFVHLQAQYQAQWMGRFFQEAGIRVMPRLQFVDLESLRYSLYGIPKNVPIIGYCDQNTTEEEAQNLGWPECLRQAINELKPDCLLVYSGPPGRRTVESAKLPKSLEIIYIENYAAKRRGVVFDNPDGKKGEQRKKKQMADEQPSDEGDA